MSIRRYVVLVLLGLIAWQLLLFSGTFYYAEYNAAVRAANARQLEALDKLRAVCQESALRTSPFAAINYAGLLAKEPAVAHAFCADFNGRVLAHTEPERIGTYLDRASPVLAALKTETLLHRGPPVVLEAFAPVLVRSQRAGVVSVGFDAQALDERISADLWQVLRRLLGVSVLTLAVVLLTALAVADRLTAPVVELARGARELARGNLDYRAPVEARDDELGFLTREFNAMAARLKEVDRLKERFLASVTHDLRAPLTGIQGHTELLMNGKLDEDQSRHLETIYYSAQHLARFINDILDLSRLEAGAMELRPAKLQPREQIASVVELLQVQAEEYNVRLAGAATPELPAVLADEKLLPRVLVNLVSNALKFTPEGGAVSVSASLDRTGAAPEVRFEVRDTGPGIPPEKLDYVFAKFAQVEETRAAARSEGTGLGLAIAKEIVQAHRGRIWAESRPGEGCRFLFTLPCA